LGVDPEGNIYATNFGENNNVQKFDKGGNFLMSFGASGTGKGQFENPIEIAVDSADNAHAVDNGNNRVQVFDYNGIYLTRLGNNGPLRTIRGSYRNRYKLYWRCICSGWKGF
jgi:DNA-binding beta-propeller fold protein YncE